MTHKTAGRVIYRTLPPCFLHNKYTLYGNDEREATCTVFYMKIHIMEDKVQIQNSRIMSAPNLAAVSRVIVLPCVLFRKWFSWLRLQKQWAGWFSKRWVLSSSLGALLRWPSGKLYLIYGDLLETVPVPCVLSSSPRRRHFSWKIKIL